MRRLLLLGVLSACVVGLGAAAGSAATRGGGDGRATAQHVLLISVDGLHQSDLAWYVSRHRGSALARLVRNGVDFTNAQTPFPSDSFPGMVAQVTGGNPSSTGVYYDDTWNHALLPAGTTNCAAAKPGVEVTYFEQLDKNPLSLDAGQGLAGLPGQHPADDRQPDDADRPEPAAGRPGHLQAGLPAPVPEGEHDLRGRTRGRPAHGLVGQAPGLRDPRRAVRHGDPGSVHARDQQRRADARRRQRLDDRQRADHAVRQLQGAGRPQRDRRLRPQRHHPRRHAGDLRDELPDGLDRGEAARLRRPRRRLPRRRRDARPAALACARLRQRQGRRDGRRDQGTRPHRAPP